MLQYAWRQVVLITGPRLRARSTPLERALKVALKKLKPQTLPRSPAHEPQTHNLVTGIRSPPFTTD